MEGVDTIGLYPDREWTVDAAWWVGHHQYDRVEFHGSPPDRGYSSEAKFMTGQLDGIYPPSKDRRSTPG